MKQSGKRFPGTPAENAILRKIDTGGLTLAAEGTHAFKEHGYNPYNTIAHVPARQPDVWRHKPKRA